MGVRRVAEQFVRPDRAGGYITSAAFESMPIRPRSNEAAAARRPDERLLTMAETAELLNCSERSVRRAIKNQELASVRIGARGVRVAPSAIREYVHARTRT